jgi:energy-coupling factor transporter ATP-binding protein EcfA2
MAPADVLAALHRLHGALGALPFALDLPDAPAARTGRDELRAQLTDYVVPRLEQMEAPALIVVGGSTGAGKSTLVNSLVGEEVSTAGVLRPTTRDPVLVCHPDDRRWFEDARVLPELPRGPGGVELRPTAALPACLALLDAPDVDSVVEANRRLARQLLGAADAWLFVTTAARYADAVPWDLLGAARERGTALALVLNRVPGGADAEIAPHLHEMLAERGLPGTELLVVPEAQLAEGRLPAAALAPVRAWLDALAADAGARAALVRRTLAGALDALPRRGEALLAHAAEQEDAAAELRAAVDGAYARALQEVDDAVRGGALLRGEVLARWLDVVGTGDLMRGLERRVGWLRDRARSLVTGAPAPEAELRTAVESSVDALVHAAADRAAEQAAGAWRGHPAGRALLEGERLGAASSGLLHATREAVRAWQGHVFELVRAEGASKRTSARLASLGVNGAGLTVMLAVFMSTGGLTGAEVVVAGGTSALGQKLLEAIFGDQAVRTLAAKAREDLLARVEHLLDEEARRFRERLDRADGGGAEGLRAALDDLAKARA